jgi:Amt family ammonium transporter
MPFEIHHHRCRYRTRRAAVALGAVALALLAPLAGRAQGPAPAPPGPPPAAAAASPAPPVEAPAAPAETPAAAPDWKAVAAGTAGMGVAGDMADAAGNLTADDAKNLARVGDAVGQNRVAINMVWTLICGFMVMFMQAGFALVETGFTRAKHAAHVLMTNFMIYPIGMLGFWICGFAFMFGSYGAVGNLGLGADALNSNPSLAPFIGWKGFFLSGEGIYSPAVYTLFLFQMVFMDTTCTIPTGAMAERWKFSAFIVYGFFISMFIYPIYGHWVWGGGWLAQLAAKGLGHGAVDFAGSGVVHAVGGWVALAGAMVLGPRIGKYDPETKKPRAIPGHNLPLAIVGTFILAFGWFGFNPGSTLGASGAGNLRIGVIATNTMLASAGGAMAAVLYWWKKYGKPDPSMSVNGMLAGLVAITAPCAFVNSWCSVVIGVLAGIVVCIAVPFIENRGIDDPVGAVSVHGVCGVLGLLCIGIFADGTYGGGLNGGPTDHGVVGILFDPANGTKQLIAQTIDSVVVIAWSFLTGFAFFKIQDAVQGIRSKKEDEIAGLDLPEMGAVAYPEFEQLPA